MSILLTSYLFFAVELEDPKISIGGQGLTLYHTITTLTLSQTTNFRFFQTQKGLQTIFSLKKKTS